ncbi:MAG: response regulator, partial [Terriglobales bacterium]
AYYLEPNVPQFVAGDPGRLRQVLANLVANAIKFTERGEVIVWVRLQSREGSRSLLRFSVQDTGIGIPAEKQHLLFQPFTQADSSMSRRYGGTGLGLAICVHLLSLMHGSIDVHSEEGRGSIFEFTLPFDDGVPGPRIPDPLPITELAGLPVLVIDDNETNRHILTTMLESCGMVVTAAACGSDGLQALHTGNPSGTPFRLVILDAHMPDMDGFAVAEKIKDLQAADASIPQSPIPQFRNSADGSNLFQFGCRFDPAPESREPKAESPSAPQFRNYSDAVIMMLTSGGQRGDGARCRQIGIAAYLVKPVRRAELMRCIASVLRRGRPQREPPDLVTRHSLDSAGARARLSVLLAEDNLVNQQLVVRLLEKDGHEVTVAADGEQAVEAARRNTFDLILVDVQMPRMDGFAATAAIRADEQASGRHTPIVAMTAHALAGYRERCLAAGMDDYLSKPAKLSEIRRVLQRIGAAQPAAGEAASPTLSWKPERALEQTDGDRDLLTEIIAMFLTESSRHLAEMDAALVARDCQRLERAAHSLKGELGCLAAMPAMERARALEQAGRNGDLESAAELAPLFHAEVDVLRRELQEGVKVDHEAAAGR